MPKDVDEIPPDALLAESPCSGRTFDIPVAISVRLDRLADRVKGEGKIHRREMLSALVLSAADDPAVLKRLIRNYRDARVKDAEISDAPVESALLKLMRNRPGPRPRHQAG